MSGESIGITEEVMEKINGYAVGELKSEQVYCFSVLLCDNDVDRDYERFSDEALDRLAVMFKGRTGIFDHDHRSRGQTARIYDTEVRSYPDRKTMDGRDYRALIGFAYMVRTEDNKSLIAEIEGGIKKEVSVGCSVAKRICSVCGADGAKGGCNHIKGRSYGGKLCYVELDEPLDAYEWSFVAVPAQRAAGVTKVYGEREVNAEIERLRAAQESFCEDLRGDIIRLGCFVKNADMGEVDKLDVFALLELKKKLSRQLREEAVTERAAGIAAAEDDESMKAFRV
ncbi:hypothetical protein [Ruminococcus albus]|uniref:Uncharacterized protein n=1 Tax=Ruminococcus albus (strain ATCC 27210 / DSM 20455 / JCM 14654 / NCDO 2250 / 7) TaxID=697329 RepID=E6UEP4_RUMA7|nr:hypothetical protein [Ruminococcus albus]ADU21813.1 hypothetical protein Rumal_1298 [Ruminococcus albus 7 = DSM 20455]